MVFQLRHKKKAEERARKAEEAAAAPTHSGTSNNDLNANMNSDVCCVCYRTFENDQREGNGLEWVAFTV